MNVQILFFTIVLTILSCSLNAQENSKLGAEERNEVIDSICRKLDREYIFPDVVVKMRDFLSSELKAGMYNSISDPKIFADRLTTDLRSISHDKHIAVSFNPPWLSEELETGSQERSSGPTAEELKLFREDNFGFKEIKILSGNLGYLRIDEFMDPRYAGETAVSAMNFWTTQLLK